MDDFEHKDPIFDYNGATVYTRDPTTQKHFTLVRHDKPKKKNSYFSYWVNLISMFIIGFCILGADFTLFTSTGAGNIFNTFPVLRPDMIISLGIIAGITAIVYFCFSGFSILLCILTGLIAYISFYAFFNQFAMFHSSIELGYSPVYMSASIAILLFALLFFCKTRYRFFLSLLFLVAFGLILNMQNRELPLFSVEEYQTTSDNSSNDKFISIMLPNLPSYTALYALEDNNTNKFYRDQLASIMLGFYAKYKFKLYTNSFAKSGNPYLNAADSLNMILPEDIHNNLQQKIIKTKTWNFGQQNNFEVYLKNNKIFDVLKDRKYKINAYQSNGINICQKENYNDVAKCVTKNTLVSKLGNSNLSTLEQSAILLVNWLESTNWLAYVAKPLYNSINAIVPIDNMPLLGTSYKNLHIINSFQALDKLLEDIKQDSGKNAYFIVLDMPSDMFLFDDMCKLKEIDAWKSKNNFPWVKRQNIMEKRSAYFQQTMCLYGKLSRFMQNLQDNGYLKDTTVIVQGLIGIDDLHGLKETSLLEDFLNTQMTPIAIYTPENKLFSINKNICSIPDIVNQFITGKKCQEFNGIGISKSTRNNVMKEINNVIYSSDKVQKSYHEYVEWLRVWNENNYQSLSDNQPVTTDENKYNDDDIVHPKAELVPLEEKSLSDIKMTDKVKNIAPEAKVKSLSEANKEYPVTEDIKPEAPVEKSVTQESPITEDIKPEAPVEESVTQEAPVTEDIKPEALVEESVTQESPITEDIKPEAPVEESETQKSSVTKEKYKEEYIDLL